MPNSPARGKKKVRSSERRENSRGKSDIKKGPQNQLRAHKKGKVRLPALEKQEKKSMQGS